MRERVGLDADAQSDLNRGHMMGHRIAAHGCNPRIKKPPPIGDGMYLVMSSGLDTFTGEEI